MIFIKHPEFSNKYIVSGEITYFETDRKTVTVNGEIYEKVCKNEINTSFEKLFESKPDSFYEREIDDFNMFGVESISVFDYTSITDYHNNTPASFGYSQNHYVNLIKNLLRSNIDCLNFVKGSVTYRDYRETLEDIRFDVFRRNLVMIKLFNYGFQNDFFIHIDFKDLIRMNFDLLNKSISYQIEKFIESGILPRYVLNREFLSNNEKRLIMLNIFNMKIKYHRERRKNNF